MDSCDQLSDERYRAFIENINDGVYETDIHGNFTYFNNALSKIFGYPREEIQGQNYSKFMTKKNAREVYGAFNKIWVTHKGFSDLIWEIVNKDGNTKTIELSANLILDPKGKRTGFRGIARDVTEKFRTMKALRESESRYQRMYESNRRAVSRARTLLDFVPYPMVVFNLDGRVNYLNPAFTEVFGWTLEELRGKHIPYVPSDLQGETRDKIKRLFVEKIIQRYETKRLTKDGRVLEVVMREAIYSEDINEPGGELVLLRDITEEKRITRINDALLRISMALPGYPHLENLLDYISGEVKNLLNVGGAHVLLLDETRGDIFFLGAAYDDTTKQEKVKEIRFPVGESIAGKVMRTGEPIIVHDTTKEPNFYQGVDRQLGYKTKNLLDVPLRSSERTIGILSARNKKEGEFGQSDIELLNMLAGTVALSIENAKYSEELKKAYQEVTSLNRAKDKVINHLSHELKTPVSVLSATLNILSKRLGAMPEDGWKPTVERAKRNLDRLLEIQYQVEDIMQDRDYHAYRLLSMLLEECTDELEALVADELGDGVLTKRLRKRIEEIFGPKVRTEEEIRLDEFLEDRLEVLAPQFAHREVNISLLHEPVSPICIPPDVLQKIVDGLLKNAIENTPDEGKIEVTVRDSGAGAEMVVRDYGVGITEDYQKRIFEGFFTTQDTMAYSSKKPFDFNAGGKGADLLRMKIFSERYNFRIDMESSRCENIPEESDTCPGRISACPLCNGADNCHLSSGTTFTLFFPYSSGLELR